MPIRTVAGGPLPTLTPISPDHAVAAKLPEIGTDRVGLGAVRRIFSPNADPAADMVGRGSGKRLAIGALDGGAKLSISRSGRFLVDGKLAGPGPGPGKGADAVATYRAAQLAAHGGLFGDLRMSSAMRGRVLARLSETIEHAQKGKRSVSKEKAFCGAMTLLIDLARSTPNSDTKVRRAILDRTLQALHREPDVEQVAFYLQAMRDQFKRLDKVQKTALKQILTRVLPKRAPVDAWTDNRTKPLEVRHMIHPEFWKEELSYFSKKNGFKLVKKNKKDTRREYVGVQKDPRGIKKPLKFHLVIDKGELDFLEPMSDPNVHVVMYSGHSALGGNGSQAVADAGPMKGDLPKLVFVANCRGKDNYAEFTNKYPEAHAIMTEHPTYGPSGQDRIEGMFDMLVRGNTYRYMRNETEQEWWDEPADNYFYPDEWRRFRFTDVDEDGKIDGTKTGKDQLFDVDARVDGGEFIRAINFANSELFYHWEIEHEAGGKSFFGRKYGDSLVPDGVIKDPKPGEIVRVTPVDQKSPSGKAAHRYRVKYNPAVARKMDENLYAANVTMHTTLALAQMKSGAITKKDVLRSVLMGAQGIHYLDVYSDSSPVTTRTFFDQLGLTDKMKEKDIDAIFEAFDAHGNDPQIAAIDELLTTKYGVDTDAWFAAWLEDNPAFS